MGHLAHNDDVLPPLRVGIVVSSDRASRGAYEDRSGPAVERYLREAFEDRELEVAYRLVPDVQSELQAALVELADDVACALIVTSGGTGPAPRDVTPEATRAVCDRVLPGLGEAMRAASRDAVPTAILSRQIAGVRGSSLIINLPGSPKAIAECLDAVFGAVPHCLRLIAGAGLA